MVIGIWLTGNLFHISSEGNYACWLQNPLRIRPISHLQLDPHFGQNASVAFTRGGTITSVNNETSGIFQIVYTVGIRNCTTLYWSDLLIVLTIVIGFISAWLHYEFKYQPIYLFNISIQWQHNLAGFIALGSMLWSSHLFHVYYSIPTFVLCLNRLTYSLCVSDILHHHLALVPLVMSIDYVSIGNGIGLVGSYHYQLGVALGTLGTLSSLVAQHIYAMPPYAYLFHDYTASVALYTHHQYIAGFLM